MLLSHQSVYQLAKRFKGFSEESVRENGYDLRICGDFYYEVEGGAVLPEVASRVKRLEFKEYSELKPLRTYLFESCEEVEMPDDVAGIMTLRSTFARNGFISPPTVIDAGYKGKITIALTSLYEAKVKKGTRVMHLIFLKLDQPTEKPYSGKYQGGKII